MSRSLVGSSITSTLNGRAKSRASRRRLRSPPESAFTGDSARSGRKQKVAQVPVDVLRRPLIVTVSWPSATVSQTVRSGSSCSRC